MMPKRIIVAATSIAALALPAAATAAVPSSTAHRYQTDYHAVAHKFGQRAPGRNIITQGLASGQQGRRLRRSTQHQRPRTHAAPHAGRSGVGTRAHLDGRTCTRSCAGEHELQHELHAANGHAEHRWQRLCDPGLHRSVRERRQLACRQPEQRRRWRVPDHAFDLAGVRRHRFAAGRFAGAAERHRLQDLVLGWTRRLECAH